MKNSFQIIDNYVCVHIINEKYAIYDYEVHNVISLFDWFPNNGYACSMLREEHLAQLPDFPYEVNKMIYMHSVIKEYCFNHTKTNEVIHHINEKRRDNRIENLIYISKNSQRALLKKIGKLNKPPSCLREHMPVLPKFCKWINAKRCFRIDSHPACFFAVENKEQKHKYIESLKGKQTLHEKLEDIIVKYDLLLSKPFYGFESFIKYEEFKNTMTESNTTILNQLV